MLSNIFISNNSDFNFEIQKQSFQIEFFVNLHHNYDKAIHKKYHQEVQTTLCC